MANAESDAKGVLRLSPARRSPLVSDDQRVPGGGAQRVDVNPGAAACRSHDEPAVRGTTTLAAVLEKVVLKVLGHLVVV